ncbi:MAG: hypothetical protein FWD46_02515 [Cystobacterineae bacterium]|nr:hypothetical protein [Cystobacterineae bacterium]
MANEQDGDLQAVLVSTMLSEIGFPEFTCKLVTDVFDALISANLRQIAAYSELLSSVSKSLSAFINDTVDDISGEEVLAFLCKLLPDGKDGSLLNEKNNEPIGEANITKINNALIVGEGVQEDAVIKNANATYQSAFAAVFAAATKRLAANKYDMLEKMMKMGLLRLVVEKGTIETKLNFKTYGYSYSSEYESSYQQESTSKRSIPGLFGIFGRTMETGRKTELKVTTSSSSSTSYSSSEVNITGSVIIHFKTDYMPLEKI